MASISPFCMAATAVMLAPTRIKAASSGFNPAFTIRYMAKKLVEDPGAVTPIFMPFCLHADGVLVGARYHVDRASHQRLQRLRAAGEVVDGDVEPLLLEVTKTFGKRQRQVIQQPLATDAQD